MSAPTPETVDEALGRFLRYEMTGSTVIDPGGKHCDLDYVCLAEDLKSLPAWECHRGKYPSGFTVLTSDGVDLVVTTSPVLYEKFVLATTLCALIRPASKGDRIAVFRAILYDETPMPRSDQRI